MDLSELDYEPDPQSGCVMWTGAVAGGAPITWDRQADERVPVRIAVYEKAHGPLPDGAEVGCVCGRDRCVALEHLDEMELDFPDDKPAVEVVEEEPIQLEKKPRTKAIRQTPMERILANSIRDPKTNCLLWQGALSGGGSGKLAKIVIYTNGVSMQTNVHRVAWIDAHGPIPRTVRVKHSCPNGHCSEISHLYAVAQRPRE